MKFQIFKEGKAVDKFILCGGYLFGTDGIVIRRAEIIVKGSLIECKKPNMEVAGLALLWPVNGFGRILLSTTCLPERAAPYNLNVEIARARLMRIINKREDWSFFDGPPNSSKEAQNLFIEAVQNISEPALASQLADKALEKAMMISEKLATTQAEPLFDAKAEKHGFGRGCLGCRINPSQVDNPEYITRLLEVFGSVTIPVNWSQIEPHKGNYDFSGVDACIEVLAKKKLAIGAGPLLCFSKEYLPRWLLRSKAKFEKIREAAYQFICEIVARYSGSIHTWCIVSSLNALNHFEFGFEQVLEMTRAASTAVKSVNDKALKIIEVSNPWGEYYATTPNTIPPLVYIDMVVQSGINFDTFGVKMRFGKNTSGMHVRDMMQVSALLDHFAHLGKPIYITNVEVPSQNGDDLYDGTVAGVWHHQWDQKNQAKWIEQFYKIALSKPFVDTIMYSNLIDAENSIIANSGLLTDKLEPKESFDRLKKMKNDIFNRQITSAAEEKHINQQT